MRALVLLFSALSLQAMELVTLPGQSPLINFRFVFRCGSLNDLKGKEGTAALTAAMLARGGSQSLPYSDIIEKFYPMAAGVGDQTDQEMLTITGVTHVDNLEAYYTTLRDMLLKPGWRPEDLKRLRDDQLTSLRVSIRQQNDEELGKEVLYNTLLGTAHPNGAVSSLEKLTLADLQAFYTQHLTQANLTIALAGKYPEGFAERVKKDFSQLPAGKPSTVKRPAPKPIPQTRVTIVKKQTRAVAFSLGFPIPVNRSHPDFPALLVANTWFGPHRSSGGNLYQRMREIRGLNYGDYSYIEYFPRGMFQFEPDPNLARRQQIFQMWIRPVEPQTAHFTLRLALHELERLVEKGLTESDFEDTRSFLSRSVNLLLKTKSSELGYRIDSQFYGIGEYPEYIRSALAKLTVEDVNKAVKKHLRKDRLEIVAVADDAEALQKALLSDAPSPMTYNSPKLADILEEDKLVSTRKLGLKPTQVRIVPVDRFFQ